MKNYLFYAILFVVLAWVFMYAVNSKRKRMEKSRDYIQQFGMDAYIYKRVVLVAIILTIILLFRERLYNRM
jgi:hypothetical protein